MSSRKHTLCHIGFPSSNQWLAALLRRAGGHKLQSGTGQGGNQCELQSERFAPPPSIGASHEQSAGTKAPGMHRVAIDRLRITVKIVRAFVNCTLLRFDLMRKGEQTRAAIVEAALELAARGGLEGLTIGSLAERMRMSKSGVFAHFGSREDLQIAVLKHYERRFVDDVLVPALREKRGLPRLRAIVGRWLERSAIEAAQGCIWVSGATEYDDRPGAVRDELVSMIRSWQRELSRAIQQAVEAGELRRDTDAADLVFDLYGVILVLHHDARLLNSPDAIGRARRAFERVLERRRPQDECAAARPAAGPGAAGKTHERSTSYLQN